MLLRSFIFFIYKETDKNIKENLRGKWVKNDGKKMSYISVEK